MLMIHFATIMFQTVGHQKIIGLQLVIVASNLIKGTLVYLDFGCLAFHQEKNGSIWIENNYIVAFFQGIDR